MAAETTGDESRPERRGNLLRRAVPALLVVVAVALVGLVAMIPNEAPPVPPREVPPINVKVLCVQAVPELADTFDLTAVVEPERVVSVAAEIPGRIEKVGSRPRKVMWRGRVFPADAAC